MGCPGPWECICWAMVDDGKRRARCGDLGTLAVMSVPAWSGVCSRGCIRARGAMSCDVHVVGGCHVLLAWTSRGVVNHHVLLACHSRGSRVARTWFPSKTRPANSGVCKSGREVFAFLHRLRGGPSPSRSQLNARIDHRQLTFR